MGEKGVPPSRLGTAVAPGTKGVSGHGESINDSRGVGRRLLMHVSIGDGTCRIGLLSGLMGGDTAAKLTSMGNGPGKISAILFGDISLLSSEEGPSISEEEVEEFNGSSEDAKICSGEVCALESVDGGSIAKGSREGSEMFPDEVSELVSEGPGKDIETFPAKVSRLGSEDGTRVGDHTGEDFSGSPEETSGLESEGLAFSTVISSVGIGPDELSTGFPEDTSISEYGGGAMSHGKCGNDLHSGTAGV